MLLPAENPHPKDREFKELRAGIEWQSTPEKPGDRKESVARGAEPHNLSQVPLLGHLHSFSPSTQYTGWTKITVILVE